MLSRLLNSLGRWSRKSKRNIDLQILWPVCKEQAQLSRVAIDEREIMDLARGAFAVHVFNDTAWTTDLSRAEINQIINNLK